jgi:dUTP pyrophosphatase
MNFSSNNVAIKFSGTHDSPRKGSPMAAGNDITSDKDYTIEPGKDTVISTGLQVALPNGWYGKIEGRSGLAFKNRVFCFGGVIDSDYRGEIKVLLCNGGTETVYIKKGDRIAQLIIQPHWNGIWDKVDELPQSVRGSNGFGSSGQQDLPSDQSTLDRWLVPDGRSQEQLNRELAGLSKWDNKKI